MSTEVNVKTGSRAASASIILLLLIAAGLAYFFFSQWKDVKAKLRIAEDNKELLVKSINTMQDSSKVLKLKIDGQKVLAAEYNTLYLDKQNIESQLSDKMKTIKALGAKIDDLKSCVTQQITTRDTIHTISYIDSLQSLYTSYKDSFISISTTIYRDRHSIITYENNEVFDLINYRVHKHEFLFFKWGKVDKFVLIPHNPNTSVKIKAVEIIND